MNWRPLGAGPGFPLWLRNLRGKSGVYAIRVRGVLFGSTVVYVGESHTGGLYKTLTRHFQSWSRRKQFWRGGYSPAQTDPGHTYDRARVEVAVAITAKSAAVARQAAWIRSLSPRDNVIGAPEVPF